MSFGLAAQSLSVQVQDYYYGVAGEECVAELEVENLTDQDLEVIVTRYSTDAVPSNFMCWALCHFPTANVTTSLVVPANATVENFSGHIELMPEEIDATIKYCFSLVNDTTDKACVDVHYTSSSVYVGLEEEMDNDFFVFPNPAQDRLNINFEGEVLAEFVLYDMLGNRVYDDVLTSSMTLNLSSFESGIYFYTFHVQGKEAAVQKLVITH